jgi:hypothetical protein
MRRFLGFCLCAALISGPAISVFGSTAAAAASRPSPGRAGPKPHAHSGAGARTTKKPLIAQKPLVPIHRSAPSQGRSPDQASSGAVVPGFDSFSLPGNDDGSTSTVPLPFAFPFFGETYTSVYINNNGNLTFGQALSVFTPSNLSQLKFPRVRLV